MFRKSFESAIVRVLLLIIPVIMIGSGAASQSIIMPVTGSEVVSACGGVFYDNGGADGSYSNNANGTITFYPTTPGGKVELTFTIFGTESCCDKIFVYDGNSMAAPVIVDDFGGAAIPAGGATITSTAEDGSLTVRFTSDGSVVGVGWAANVSCDLSDVISCDGSPTGGTATASPGSGSFSSSFVLTATGVSGGDGVSYQWEESEDELTWTEIAGATSVPYFHVSPATVGITYYRLRVECTGSDDAVYSTVTSYAVVPVFTMPLTGTEVYTTCGGTFYDSGGPDGNYSNGANSTVTFYPSTPGAKVELTFTSFSTESCCDKIFVYDGNSITAPILVNDFGGAALPAGGATLTSSALDGSLTVRFTSDGSVVSTGWVASLTCDMSGAVLCEGTPLGGTAAATPSTGGPSSSFMLSSAGVTAAIGIEYQWESSADGVTGWEDVPSADFGTYSMVSSASFGTTYYRLRVLCTESDEFIYSTVTSYTVVPVFTMPVTGTASYTTCSGTFYDSGGPDGNYSNGANSTVTFYPSTPGAKVELTFTSFSTESCCDKIFIYDGNSTAAPTIVSDFGGTGLPFAGATMTSTAGDGSLTVRFTSDGSVVAAGWVANLSCDMSGAVLCEGAPEGGIAAASPGIGGPSSAFMLSSVGVTAAIGIEYQWESSEDGVIWEDVPGAVFASYSMVSSSSYGTTYYRLRVLCTESDETIYSTLTSYSVVPTFTMPVTGSVSHTTCSGVFYDNGGADGNYSNSVNGTTTFYPSTIGAKVQLTFVSFATESCCDKIFVYDGNSTAAPAVVSDFGGTALPAGGATITSTASDGSLTVRFTSDGSVVAAGWVANLGCDMSGVCLAPLGVTVSDETTTSATVSWAIDGPSIGVDIEYGVEGFEVGEGTLLSGVTSPFLIEDLIPSTNYEFVIINRCNETASSPIEAVYSFSTSCLAPEMLTSSINSICDEGSVMIVGEPSAHGVISWFEDELLTELLQEGDTFLTPAISESTTFYAQIKVGNIDGCVSEAYAFNAVVHPAPELTVEPAVQYACYGDTVSFEATESPDYVYIWSNGEVGSAISVVDPGVYSVQITDENGCVASASGEYIHYPVATIDGFDFIPAIFSNPLIYRFIPVNAENVTGYLWDFGDGNYSTEENPEHTYAAFGEYHVTLYVYNDCDSVSSSLPIFVQPSTGIENLDDNTIVNVYPNPTKHLLNVSISENDKIVKVKIYNQIGQLVKDESLNQVSIYQIAVDGLAQGTYFVQIETAKAQIGVRTFIVQ